MPSLAINRLRIVKQVDNHSFNLAKNIPMQATLQTPKFFTWLSLSWGDRVVVLVTKKKQDKTNKNTGKTYQNATHFKTWWHEQQSITKVHKIEKANVKYIENWKWLDNLCALVSIEL